MAFPHCLLRGAIRRVVLAGLLALVACSPERDVAKGPPPSPGSLEWAAAGPWRFDTERDAFRHPVQTLSFFGVKPNMTVIEIYPGRGWYSAVLAPYLKGGGGHLIVAGFDPVGASDARLATLADFKQRFSDTKTYGDVEITSLSSQTNQIAPTASADMVLIMGSLSALMAEKKAQPALAQAFAALKPGGVLGIEEARARSTGLQDPQAGAGYVQEQFVKLLAEEAGFKFAGSSEINANPKDTKDHPFGVWTLPPVLATAPLGQPDNPSFDSAPFRAIGESDRMTLKFVKPDPSAPSAAPSVSPR